MTWQTTADPRIQVEHLGRGAGWRARYWKAVPATRIRCDKCGKDLVSKQDGTLHLHKCEGEQGWAICVPVGKTGYNCRELAIDAAARKANIPSMRIQMDWVKKSAT